MARSSDSVPDALQRGREIEMAALKVITTFPYHMWVWCCVRCKSPCGDSALLLAYLTRFIRQINVSRGNGFIPAKCLHILCEINHDMQ